MCVCTHAHTHTQELMTVGGEVNKTLKRRALTGDDAAAAYFGRYVCFFPPTYLYNTQ